MPKRGAPEGCPTPHIITNGGHTHWSLVRGKDGHKTYKLKNRVQVNRLDGPNTALSAPGLPLPGSAWNVDNDFDQWAYCTQEATVTQEAPDGEVNEFFDVEQVFSTEPSVLCPDDFGGFEDPLLRADIIRGNFTRYNEEAVADRYGRPIITSSFEQFRGPQVEFDRNRPQVKITQNVADLELELLCALIDSVNDFPMWGFGARCVKFSACEWTKHYHTDCTVFYTRTLEFDINAQGWDRILLDESTKVLNGQWNPSTGRWDTLPVGVATLSMNRTNGTNTLTVGTGDISKIVAGQTVTGTGIPDGTTVTTVADPTITISQNATSTGTDPITFKVPPDANNPTHYMRFKDKNGENTRVMLNGAGVPALQVGNGQIRDVEAGLFLEVTTWVAHGLSDGDVIVISGVTGLTAANGTWTVTVLDATRFTIDNPTSAGEVYTGGGSWIMGPPRGPGMIRVEKYPSLDLTQLRIPGTL